MGKDHFCGSNHDTRYPGLYMAANHGFSAPGDNTTYTKLVHGNDACRSYERQNRTRKIHKLKKRLITLSNRLTIFFFTLHSSSSIFTYTSLFFACL